MKWKVLITCPPMRPTIDPYRDFFVEHGIDIALPPLVQQLTEAELLEIIDQYDGVIAGDDQFSAKVLEKGKRLRVIAKWGIGLDGIDLAAAKRLGIRVSNTPDVFADEVGDVVMGYIILLARQLQKMDQSVRDGGWLKIQGMSLRGKTLGVIGLGSIGQAVARRAAAAGMELAGCDIVAPPAAFIDEIGIELVGFEELLQKADFISLNCNLNPDNRHMLSEREFDMVKPGAYVINTARGPLIDEIALAQAIQDGRVAGAALDVFENEPLPLDSPLRNFDNCVFGTHNSSNTREAVMRVNEIAIANLLAGLENGN